MRLTKKLRLKWSEINTKLKKTDTVSFSLPAIAACPQAGVCAAVCYATQGAYIYPNVKAARQFNFDFARFKPWSFQIALEHDLGLIKQTSIRIHDSGDFFDQTYLETWFRVIVQFPAKDFYAYTKSLHLDFTGKPDNLTIIQSEGGKLDHLIDKSKSHARIFATDGDRVSAGYQDGNIDDSPAQRGEILIGLVYHGTKNLTDSQKERFA